MLSANCQRYFPDGGHYTAGCPACDPLSSAYTKSRFPRGSAPSYTAVDAVQDVPRALQFARKTEYCGTLRSIIGCIARNYIGATLIDPALMTELGRYNDVPDAELLLLAERVAQAAAVDK